MKRLPLFAIPLFLLLGCTGVSQGEYDALKETCNEEKGKLSAQLELKEARIGELTSDVARCNVQKQSLDAEISAMNSQISVLKNDSNILKQARAESDRMRQFDLALSYYNDAYGEGKIPNNLRLNRIETQVQSLSDPPLYASWKAVRGCGGIVECENAKANFTGTIEQRKTELVFQIALIVK
ncbi:TPA: hypothetical protein HA225_03805 [Candidatus Micrarchaeota archaeon]|nr:hypothetical protein [Candidatus Micrarchaeota archaeon]HIH30246.1 hypothetical protein [Candidatus Micrarchaeota archaeon]